MAAFDGDLSLTCLPHSVILRERRLLSDWMPTALAVASATAMSGSGSTARISLSVSGWCL